MDTLIAAAHSRHPQWDALLEALRVAARALDDPTWADAAGNATLPPARPEDAPILRGTSIPAPADALAALLGALTASRYAAGDAVRMIEAAIRHDAAGLPDGPLAVKAGLAAMPLLSAVARVHAGRVPPHWPHGYCPVCGAWAVLVEVIGVERARRLRCGRCATGWASAWLTCPYCGERDHGRLGSLVPEATRETQRVETCGSCGGYVKSLTTLLPSGALELAIRDLDTVELDIAAVDHGFARPAGLGYSVDVQLVFPC